MADTEKTIGTASDYADPILWAAAEGAINDGNRAVGITQNDIVMSGLFRPNQAFINGGLLKGKDQQTGKSGDGQKLGNTGGTRICLAPSPNLSFQDLEGDIGANTYFFQNVSTGTSFLRIIDTAAFLNVLPDNSVVATNSVINGYNMSGSTTAGALTANNCTLITRVICRNNNFFTALNCNSLATDWYLGRGTDAGTDSLVNFCYILQNAPASDFGTGSSDNTLNTDTTLEMVNVAGGDYRIKSTSVLATAGQGGTFVGAFLEVGGDPTVTPNMTAIGTVTLSKIVIFANPFSYSATGTSSITKKTSKSFGYSALASSNLAKEVAKTLSYSALGTVTQDEGFITPLTLTYVANGLLTTATQFIAKGTAVASKILKRIAIKIGIGL